VTELCSGQALGDADADNDKDAADTDAADTADKSNPYMSPFQGDTKIQINALDLMTLNVILYKDTYVTYLFLFFLNLFIYLIC
jgi:hypothetical protein